MLDLPRFSGQETIRVFQSPGFSIVRQSGSRVVLRRGEFGCVIPCNPSGLFLFTLSLIDWDEQC